MVKNVQLPPDFLDNKVILITGGTGSFGKKCVRTIIDNYKPRKVIVFSRDELKQFEMDHDPYFSQHRKIIRYFIGDVRDYDRLLMAFHDVDYVIHAAALKQVVAGEYNPFEVIKTNVIGAQNIIEAAIKTDVKKVIALSTDKAANPVNLYGATKLCSDKLFISASAYSPVKEKQFAVVRYGNVVGSRGSVVPFFKEKAKSGVLPITDTRMTRFWVTLDQGVKYVLHCLHECLGGELFVPKIPSMRITDLAEAIGPECRQEVIGIRPGEKLHEVMVSVDDSVNTVELDNYYIILPAYSRQVDYEKKYDSKPVPDGFQYSSDSNDRWLNKDELLDMINES